MRYIIEFVASTPQADIDQYLASTGCQTVSVLLNLGGIIYLVEAPGRPDGADIVVEIVDDGEQGVELLSIRPEIEYRSFVTDDVDNWWKVAVITDLDYDAVESQIVRTGHGLRVYLVDSGIDANHADFENQDIVLLHSKTADFADTTGHGTALASVIVGQQCGISDATLNVVKIIEDGSPTRISEILHALDVIANDYLNDISRPALVNLSWSIPKNEYVEAKILSLIHLGLVIVCAAGNSGIAVADATPASMPEVITVGSFGQNLRPSDFSNYTGPSITSYTAYGVNYGPGLDVFAPGELIRVAVPGGGFGFTVGTSISSAIMTAVCAVNLAMVNATYSVSGYDRTVYVLREHYMSRNFLTLDGLYGDSVNAIPRARLSKLPEDAPPRVPRAITIVASGEMISIRIFDAAYYTSAEIVSSPFPVEIVENYLHGLAPDVATMQSFFGEIRLSDGTLTPFHVVVYNPSAYPTPEEAYMDSDLVSLACGCPSAAPCCGACTKSVCSECAVGSAGNWICQ